MGSEGLALCLDEATDSYLGACRRRHPCGCRRKASSQATLRGEQLPVQDRVFRRPVCVRYVKVARGGRCGSHRSSGAVRVTPGAGSRRAPRFCILAGAGRRWRHGLQSNVRTRLRHPGGSGHRRRQWTAGRISAQVQRFIGQDCIAARKPARRPNGPPKSYLHCALEPCWSSRRDSSRRRRKESRSGIVR
jgi:hypothetical protein